MGRQRFKTSDFIAAIPGTGGIISTIAARVGCKWHTAKKYIETVPSVREAYLDEVETTLDMVEVKLILAARNGDAWAIKYLLSTKGKHRGFSERTELDVTTAGRPIIIEYHVANE